jgi:DNA-binding transcriptional LysR family regulator
MNVSSSRADSLSFQQIYTFCTVYECGGYAGASEQIGLSGPTMWEQVRTLERIYQTKLFQRSGRNIVPTESAKRLYEMLSPVLVSVESSFQALEEMSGVVPKQIRLITGVRMVLDELAQPLADFRTAYPDVSLRLMNADNHLSQQLVADGQADIALMIQPPAELEHTGLKYIRLYKIDQFAALPAKHPLLLRKSRITIANLEHEPLIVGNSNTIGRKMFEQAWFRQGIQSPMRIVVETDNSAVTMACVRVGMGIGVLAGTLRGMLTEWAETRSLSDELGFVYVSAVIQNGRQITPHLQGLLDRLAALA